mgnify:CR=1
MKTLIEFFKSIPDQLLEILFFAFFVLMGSVYKMLKQKEHGAKITAARFLVEAFMSFFIAFIVYAFIDQFFHFNRMLTFAICSFSGSVSSTFHAKLEEFLIALFDGAKVKVNQYLKITKDGQ